MWLCRKASASVLAIDERQNLETLTRDEKTAGRGLSQLKEKFSELDGKKGKLEEEVGIWGDKRTEVCFAYLMCPACLTPLWHSSRRKCLTSKQI